MQTLAQFVQRSIRRHWTAPFFTLLILTGGQAAKSQTVRVIEPLNSDLALSVAKQVNGVPTSLGTDTSVLLEGAKLFTLSTEEAQTIRRDYLAGYPIVLINPRLEQVTYLQVMLGAKVDYRLTAGAPLQAFSIRKESGIPHTMLLFTPAHRRPTNQQVFLITPLTNEKKNEVIFRQAVKSTVGTLGLLPSLGSRPPVRSGGSSSWQDSPIHISTMAINNEGGVFNTSVSFYALHRCQDNTDHYVVTAGADWTAQNAIFASAGTEDNSIYATNDGFGINWQDNPDGNAGYCGVSTADIENQHVCRYSNYPLSYSLSMTPPPNGNVVQLNAAPSASQGSTASYESGFSFSISGSVNVSGDGPNAGFQASATWDNSITTEVPPLQLGVSNTGNEGVIWNFQYCTAGKESDGSSCTSHVQTTNGCRNRLGDTSGANPQQGQTPNGKFSNAIQSVHWQEATPDRPQGNSFDVTVNFNAAIAYTIADLYTGGTSPDTNPAGCSDDGCSCESYTTSTNDDAKVTFSIPYPATQCTSDRIAAR